MNHDAARNRAPLIVLALGAATIAVTVFGVPLGTVLLFGLLLLCPLAMTTMHGGQHVHGRSSREPRGSEAREEEETEHPDGGSSNGSRSPGSGLARG